MHLNMRTFLAVQAVSHSNLLIYGENRATAVASQYLQIRISL